MNDQKFLRETYPFDPETGTYTIPMSIERYADFFTDLDPSPFPKRDLASDLITYLKQCSDEIPVSSAVLLEILIRTNPHNPQSEQECTAGLRSFYHHEMFVEGSEIRRKRWSAFRYLLVSLLSLSAYIATEKFSAHGFLLDLGREALLIGGWLFMWEAVTVNFIEMDKHYQAIKKFKRLIQAKINFIYPSS